MPDDAFDIRITRYFAASREAVFNEWLTPESLRDWFVPDGMEAVSAEVDGRTGGHWQVVYRPPNGQAITEEGSFTAVEPPERLVMTLNQTFEETIETIIHVAFEVLGEGTLMHFHQQGIRSAAQRNGMTEGWVGCFNSLANRIETVRTEQNDPRDEAEVRAFFADWFDASARKDLDASMAPIAVNIVSYEHSPPLEVRDIETMRKECKIGFDQASDTFRWDVPDMQVLVRGDIATTWGLNRMAEYENGKPKSVMWSRGTRVLQRREGRWHMIHQHVSFPVDREKGTGAFDEKPEGDDAEPSAR